MISHWTRALGVVTLCVGHALHAQPARSASARSSAQRAVEPIEVTEASVADLRAAMASGRVTAVQLVDAYLARIVAYDHAGPQLNSLIRINPKARAEAAVLDSERRVGRIRGSLHGIPVIIKDNYDTFDMPTTGGSLALVNSQPSQDAFVVKKLRDAGAIILAKSNLHELAAGITSISSLGGQTRNPYEPTRCPGGSSGGTGAAIAASFAAVGWGSDTCGSIRIPSAYGSLVGLRPTQGLVSRSGIIPLSSTQDIGGPMARTVTDLAIALDVSVGYDAKDSVTRVLQQRPLPKFEAALDRNALRGARIGVFRPYFADTDAEIADTVRAAIGAMKAQGAIVVDVALAEFDTLIANTSVIPIESKFDLINYLATVPNAPVHSYREILDKGLFDKALEIRFRSADTVQALNTDRYRLALRRQGQLRARFEHVMDSLSLDVLAYPTMRQKPTLVGEVQTGGTCNLSAQSGLPAISVQAGFSAEGLPIGIELMGRAFTDTRLVALAYAFEQSGARRRAPFTTPALVRGAAPAPTQTTVVLGEKRTISRTSFTYSEHIGALSWRVLLGGTHPQEAVAVVISRASTDGARVMARLIGPGMASADGVLRLNAVERRALDEGKLSVVLYSSNGAAPSSRTIERLNRTRSQ